VPRDICPCTARGLCPNSGCDTPKENSSIHEEHRENYFESYTTTETYTSSTTKTISKSNEYSFPNTHDLGEGNHGLRADKNTIVGEGQLGSLFPASDRVSSSQDNSSVMEGTNDAVPKVKGESGTGQIERQSLLRTDISESIASTVSQSLIHTTKASLSDSVNWGIAIPATVTGIVTVGLAGYALKLQRNGIETQERQLSATNTMAATLQQIKDRLNTLAAVVEAERVLNDRDETDNSNDEEDDPLPSVPRLSEDNARIFQFIISTIKNSLIPSGSSVESHPRDDDSQSRYTSEEHAEEATNPTTSLNLLPLEGQAKSHSVTAAEEISQGQNSITTCPLLKKLQDRFLQLQSRKPNARELQNIASEPILPQRDSRNNSTSFILSDLELSPEDDHLFNNLHEEVEAPEWLDL
jgi:hypothetical protein